MQVKHLIAQVVWFHVTCEKHANKQTADIYNPVGSLRCNEAWHVPYIEYAPSAK